VKAGGRGARGVTRWDGLTGSVRWWYGCSPAVLGLGESLRIRALRILPLIGAVSLALMLILFLADSVVAQPSEFVETGADRLFGITVCPDGYAVEGMEVARGRLLCRAYGLGKPDVFADYSTERDGMHACPEGTYVRGYSNAHNILICSFDISSGATTFLSGDIRSPANGHSPPQRAGMHVCSATDFSQVVVGVHASTNTFLCRQLPAAQRPGPLHVPASFDPTRPRGLASFVPSLGDLATWRAITLNWLTHILNLPMPGTAGDPRCVRLDQTFAQLNPSVFGPTSPRFDCPEGPSRAISDLSLMPAPRGPGCFLGGKQVAFDKRGFGPDGVRQFLLEYRSPVLPTLAKPIQAYLTLPPGYSPTGSYPAVVVTHGHHDAEKESLARCPGDSDHANALVLAEHGAITLAPDTITFGDYNTHEGDTGACAFFGGPHHKAVCALRVGTLMQRYVLDNMVRVSLIETVPGVDRTRISTAGLSLGGWQALWTAALDTRVSRVVAAGIFKRLDKMEWQSANDLCQTVPALSTAFLNPSSLPGSITPASMLITTPDLAGLLFGHAALLSTWYHRDAHHEDDGFPQVGGTLTDTTRVAAETGGTYISEIAPRLLERSIPDSHEFYSFLTKPGSGPVQTDPNLGAVPFLLGGPPIMITSPRAPQTIPADTLVTLSANVRPTGQDPVQVTWRTASGTLGTGNPLSTRLTPADNTLTAIATDTLTGATSQAEVTINVGPELL
jgi:hypothetical protein